MSIFKLPKLRVPKLKIPKINREKLKDKFKFKLPKFRSRGKRSRNNALIINTT